MMDVEQTIAGQPLTLLARFAQQACRHPEDLAIIDRQARLSYSELASASERIARGLLAHGVQPGQCVALSMPRCWQWIASLLGVLKVGAIVVPLDRASPVSRRDLMLADGGCVGVLSLEEEVGPVGSGSAWQASVDALLDYSDQPPQVLAEKGAEVSLLFYTSGTTGVPKAVEVGERGLLRLAQPGTYIDIHPGDRFACLSNPAFDACSFELWAPLLNGGCCVIIAEEDALDAERLAGVLERQRVDTLFMTVSLFNAVSVESPRCFASLRQVLIGGEQVSAAAVRNWYATNPDSACQLFNVYGPTECSTFALCYPIPRDFSGDTVPIGWPLAETGLLILDEGQRPVADGAMGELYLSGSGVARGYRNRPEQTAHAFLRLPGLDPHGGLHYRTGDLVRRHGDGPVEYLGRVDRQVKVRGFRIEPGEIEQRLLEHPLVRQAYVCARRHAAEDHQLLAYIVPTQGLEYAALDTYLGGCLPTYMRPHQLFLLERMPLTANGKIDRDALLAQPLSAWRPAADASVAGEATPALRWLLAQAALLLGHDGLGGADDWLASGGDSLKAMRLRSAMRSHWQREIPMASVLGESFASLASRLTAEQSGGRRYPPAPLGRKAQRAPASAEQRRLWLVQQRTPESTAYSVPLIVRFAAGVSVSALAEALQQLVARHAALRTAFTQGADGLEQVIAEEGAACRVFAHGEYREDNWQAFAALVFATPFDLSMPTLFQAYLLPFDDGSCRLLLNMHHIIVDGWSMNLLFEELTRMYAHALAGWSSAAVDAPLTTLEFAQWQGQWSVDAHYRDQRRSLAELYRQQEEPSPAMPAPRSRKPGAALHRQPLGAERIEALERFCSEQRLTRFEVLFSVFAWSLYALTGSQRPRIASPVANRPLGEFEDSIGMFANTVLIPASADDDLPLGDQLRQQTAIVRAVLALQDVALADVVEDLRLTSGMPLFDFMFVLENTDYRALATSALAGTLEFDGFADGGHLQAKCPLTLLVVGTGARTECWWEYQCSYFDAEQVKAVNALFACGLDLLLTRPAATLDDLIRPWRNSLAASPPIKVSAPPFSTLADWFEHQARCTPAATALVNGQRTVRYDELDALADHLAGELTTRYPLPDVEQGPAHVVLLLEPSVEHIVALLALAKLNLTAVPLDPGYPPAIQRQVVAQARPHCLLFSADTEAAVQALDASAFNQHRVELASAPTDPAQRFQRPRHSGQRPLYTLFTSGSTGTPKGVRVPDITLCNLLHWQRTTGELPAQAVTLQFSMLSFDVSLQEIFSTLCGGGCYHLITPRWRQDAQALLAYLQEARIERLFLPYVALQHIAETAVHSGIYPASLREVVTAGEQLLCTEALRAWFAGLPRASLFNHYGPTETHVVSAWRLPSLTTEWPLRAPIGRAVDNARLLLVDSRDRPVPAGSQGYLLVAGPMVSPCYLADPTLNTQRFVALSLPGDVSRLFYRTGDLAWASADGCLHYLGRDDQQVKLSGHRLELGQIEAALMQAPEVTNAVVTLDAQASRLTAYVQCAGATPSAQALDRLVGSHLPGHVRMDAYRCLDAWPRTPSGKIDRKALNGLGEPLGRPASPAPALPMSATEQQLSELFTAVLGRRIEPDQTFFEAGATSLGLMRLHARYSQALPGKVSMADLFEHVTIRRLAAHVAAGESAPAVAEARQAVNVSAVTRNQPMAIIGMAVNVAGASDLGQFWQMVCDGEWGIEHFAATEGRVGARSQLAGMLEFDPEYFGISRQEARLMDPQQRHLLMACVQALQHAAITPGADGPRIGLIASCGETTYFQQMLREAAEGDLPDGFQMALHHDKDFLATKAAYHLDFNGPSMSVQAACGSSLIAVHLASAMLRQGDSDVMLAAGVLIDPTLSDGYRHRSQHIFSSDGLCRPFSDDASGTIGASGYGVVVLKPLDRASADGDRIYGVIEASALNNDGHGKMSYTAPSVAGQGAVIADALAKAGVTGADIGYVEAHGTGTLLGDPVEVAALTKAFGAAPANGCALASVKSQIGHLGAAAGVVGLIRATLAVYHGVVPPNLGFGRINPQIDLEHSPFYIPTTSRPWPQGRRRLAGVSSFGIGGTNAHVIIGGPPASKSPTDEVLPYLLISAHSQAALLRDMATIEAYLQAYPERQTQLLRHLQAGRRSMRWRFAMAVSPDRALRLDPALIQEALPGIARLNASHHSPETLLDAWRQGAQIDWPGASAPPPWDLPPSAFDLESYRFQTSALTRSEMREAPAIERQPLADWFYQRQWMRIRRLDGTGPHSRRDTLVICSYDVPDTALLNAMGKVYTRVIHLRPNEVPRQTGPDCLELNLGDVQGLSRLLDEWSAPGSQTLDWLHALPLSVTGAVDELSMATAQLTCLDTVAMLLQAWGLAPREPLLRVWLMSWQASPVHGEVRRPELAALAGISEVAPQEYPVRCHWLDLPTPHLGEQAEVLAALLANPDSAPRRLAIRDGYLWQPRLVASPQPAVLPTSTLLPADGTFLVLGGSGGIGRTLAEHLLRAPHRRVLLLSRHGELPATLAGYGERVEMIKADLGDLQHWPALLDELASRYGRFAGVIHAAGVGAGSLIRHRDAQAMSQAMAAKTRGMLALEALIARMEPGFVLYCSSMSALFGGAGHLDYSAASGVLDGFVHYQPARSSHCLRLGINWDIWREVGMAVSGGAGDAAHQVHLGFGMSAQEGCRVFDLVMAAQLPQMLISTTAIDTARRFYPTRHGTAADASEVAAQACAPAAAKDVRGRLHDCLCKWLGETALDDQASLYDLGADSLTLLDLIDELQAATGEVFQLSQFSHKVSLGEVLALVAATDAQALGGTQGTWEEAVQIDQWHAGAGREWLYLIHPVGGDVQAYRELVAALPPELGVCVIADPALRLPELPDISLDERAAWYLRAIQARQGATASWRLAGWSFGAWVAQAMCAQAPAGGQPMLYLIDPPAPDAGAELGRIDEVHIQEVFRREFAQRWPGATGDAMPADKQAYLQRLTRCCQHNIASMGSFEPPRLAHTQARLFIATQANPYGVGEGWDMDALHQAWRALLPCLLGWQLLDTDHYGVVTGPWARGIAEMISADPMVIQTTR